MLKYNNVKVSILTSQSLPVRKAMHISSSQEASGVLVSIAFPMKENRVSQILSFEVLVHKDFRNLPSLPLLLLNINTPIQSLFRTPGAEWLLLK